MTAHRLSGAIFGLIRRIMPAARREWIAAMQAELRHLPDDKLHFTLGCLAAACQERMLAMFRMPALAVTITAAVFILLAGFAGASAVRMASHADLAPVFALVSVSYVVAAGWCAWRGARGLIEIAMIMLTLSLLGSVALRTVIAPGSNDVLLRGLSLECVAIWAVALAIGALLTWATAARRAPA